MRAAYRMLSPPSRGVHLGLMHVYKLRHVSHPHGERVRLLFPAGVRSAEESAAQLARAAEEGRPVLITVAALKALLSPTLPSVSTGEILPALASNEASPTLSSTSSPTTSSSRETAALETAPSPLVTERSEGGQGRGEGQGGVKRQGGGEGEGGWVGLVRAENAIAAPSLPLSQLLSSAVKQPDWRRTSSPSHSPSTPSPQQLALLHAAAGGEEKALSAALASCSREEVERAALPPSGGSPLHLAAGAGHQHAVEALLAAGGSVHTPAVNGSTPLHWAAGGGHVEAVRSLLRAGADTRAVSSTWGSTVRGDSSGQTAAHWAAASGQTETLELLLEADPHALLLEDERQLTLGKVAASNGHGWLDHAMQRLKREPVVCVRVEREMTLQKAFSVKDERAEK